MSTQSSGGIRKSANIKIGEEWKTENFNTEGETDLAQLRFERCEIAVRTRRKTEFTRSPEWIRRTIKLGIRLWFGGRETKTYTIEFKERTIKF